jgi:dipeptidyl aminopeptidase/acylaminoacyl peptidase
LRHAALALLALLLASGAPAAQRRPEATLAFTRSAASGGVYLLAGGRLRLAAPRADDASWSPDGRRLAYVAPGAGAATDLFVADADGTHRGRITWTEGVDETSPSWAPDGKRLVVERGAQIVTVRSDGSGQRVLAAGMEPAWSPGGRRIAYGDGDDLFVVGARRRDSKARLGAGHPKRAGVVAGWAPPRLRLGGVRDP